MNRALVVLFAGLAGLLCSVMAVAITPEAELGQLKQKIESGTPVTNTEILRARALASETGIPVDIGRAKREQSDQSRRESFIQRRHPGNPLDEYIWSDVPYEWIDIEDIGTNTGIIGVDQNVGPFDLGFDFTFYEQTYSSVRVCTHGCLTFTGLFTDYINSFMPDPEEPNAMICGFWDDVDPAGIGQVLYYADEANDRFIVSWINCDHWFDMPDVYTFQIVLYADGNIRFNYQLIDPNGPNYNTTCTVGIENEDGSEGVQICFDGDGTLPVSETSLFVGQPDGVPGPVTNLQGQTVGEDVQLSWINPTEDTNGNPVTVESIQVWLGVPPGGTLLATLPGSSTNYTHANAPDGNLTYSVRCFANTYYGPPRTVAVLVGTPSYFEDFEVTEGLWETETGGWEWGVIDNPGLFGAHSGTHVWAVGLHGNYSDQACYYLDLNVGLAVSSPSATVEFWTSWSTETWWDGVNFKVSVDEGLTWQTIEPLSGYDQPQLSGSNACIPNEPGWSGFGQDWQYVVLPIGQFEGEVPIFRLSFGSDFSVIYPGFAIDDMIIWGLQPPVGAPVSGTISLDGGAGNITNVNVRANGLGTPQDNPNPDGTYLLENVLVGNRTVWAELAGYHTASTQVTLDSTGLTGVNLTLVRLDPPAPLNLVGSVDNDNGFVTLNWNDSPDPLVDNYNVYRRLQGEDNWTLVGNVTQSQTTHTLPVDGVYEMAVTAIDEDVSTPVESELSEEVLLLYGAIPPVGLTTNGHFDDRIRLHWFAPGTPPQFELFYDDSTAETSIGWWFEPFAAWFVARFQGEGSVTVNRLKAFFTNQAMQGNTYEMGIFEDNNGLPGANPVFTVEGTHEDLDIFREFEVNPPVTIESGIFYVGVRQIGFNPVSLGGDNTTPFINETFYYTFDMTWWNTFEIGGWMSIPMLRCYAMGEFDQDVEMIPGPIDVTRLPFAMPEVDHTAWATTIGKGKFENRGKTSASKNSFASKTNTAPANPVYVADGNRVLTEEDMHGIRERAETAVMPHAPYVVPVSERDPNHSLDDLDYYIVYRGGVDIAHPTVTTYDDVGRVENVDYIYTVAAHYDNGEVSTLAGPDTARCNMAPMAPTGLTGVAQGNTQIQLSWTNPTTNEDGSALVDLAGVRVFRNGVQITQVAPGITQYLDTPPDPQQLYTWTLQALDEVPNISDVSESYRGYVISPWEEVDYEWIDIGDIGNDTGMEFWDQISGPFDIGFDFPYLGQTYSQLWISDNGWVSFNEAFWSSSWNEMIPTQFDPNNVLFAFWDDLYLPSSGQVLYWSNPDEGQFVITWLEIDHAFETGEIYTFQIVLNDDGSVYYNYHTIPTDGFNGNISCTVGIENSDGSDGVEVCYNGVGNFLPETETSIAFWAGPSGEINGVVREFSTNLPIQNAQVYVDAGEDTILTDASGNYVLGIDPGTYTLRVHKQGYCDESFPDVIVVDDGVVTRNATMRQPNVEFSVTSLNMLTVQGQNTSTTFEISNPSTATICPVQYSISDNADWLSCTPPSGSVANNATQEITVSANVAGLPVGDHDATITVNHNDNGNPMIIPVTLSIALAAGDEASLPKEFAFHQNYPNPFNATTSLRFDVPAESHVEISIYNVMGQEIAKPVNAVYPAGSHSYSFTADNLPSGMYLMRMKAGSFSAMNKMVLLK